MCQLLAHPLARVLSVAPGMRVPYPVRRADQPFIAEPTEAKDQAAGAEYRNNLVNAQMAIGRKDGVTLKKLCSKPTKLVRSFTLKKAAFLGKLNSKIRMAIGSSEYDMLAKDLANMADYQLQGYGVCWWYGCWA